MLRDDIQRYIPNFHDTIYCIDHYLAKKSIRDIINVRFKDITGDNARFKFFISGNTISSIDITSYEKKGIVNRMYFDDYGIIRDIVQNHILQIVSVLTCDQWAPSSKAKALQDITTVDIDSVKCGQYDTYTTNKHVKQDSKTPTFAMITLHVNNPLWKNIPINIKVGKGMKYNKTEIIVRHVDGIHKTKMQIQPQPRKTSLVIDIGDNVEYVLSSKEDNDETPHQAYETLIKDALNGDKSLFVSFEEIEESWRILQNILDNTIEPFIYPFGSDIQ
jgi:glucose-6-phosphate 1-dehydrogenase